MRICLAFIFSFILLSSCTNADQNTQIQKAKQLIREENYEDAIEILDELIENNPYFDSAYIERAYCYKELNKPELAIADANEALNIDRFNAASRYIRGSIFLDCYYDIEQAESDFKAAWKYGDSTYQSWALHSLAEIAYIGYNTETGFYYCNELLKLSPNEPAAYTMRGLMYSHLDLFKEFKLVWDSLQTSPESLSNYFRDYYIKHSLYREEPFIYDTKNALRDLDHAIDLNPYYPLAYFHKAQILLDLDRLSEALEQCNAAIWLYPKNADFYLLRANIYFELNEPDLVLKDMDKAVEIDHLDYTRYLDRASYKLYQLGDENGAKEGFENARELGWEGPE